MKLLMTKLLSIIVTLMLCIGYIYLRFIRERLPKDIPFELTVLGFFYFNKYMLCLFINHKKSINEAKRK